MMVDATYGSVRYIENYLDAPKTAEYILRRLSDNSIVLEHYMRGNCQELAHFPFDYYWENKFYETLTKCREIMNCSKILWIEEPDWRYYRHSINK